MTDPARREMRFAVIGAGRLSGPAMHCATERTQVMHTVLHGGGLTRAQIDAVDYARIARRAASLWQGALAALRSLWSGTRQRS